MAEWVKAAADRLAGPLQELLDQAPEFSTTGDAGRHAAVLGAVGQALNHLGLHEHIYGVVIKGTSVINPVTGKPASSTNIYVQHHGPDTGGRDIGPLPPPPRPHQRGGGAVEL